MFSASNFLRQAGVVIILIGLSYGIHPQQFLGAYVQLPALTVDVLHIFKGVMGMYVGLALFWIWAANKTEYQRAAVLSCVVFMAGLAAGRMLSLLTDGMASPLLMAYAVAEVSVACMGCYILKRKN
ncbi:MAG: DUF4345 domain-containing protein [Formosimonas sp.]